MAREHRRRQGKYMASNGRTTPKGDTRYYDVVDKNGKRIGRVEEYPSMLEIMQKLMRKHKFGTGFVAGALSATIALSSASALHQGGKNVETPAPTEVVAEATVPETKPHYEFDLAEMGKGVDATYIINYVVQPGDSLSKIAYRIVDTHDEAYAIVSDICYRNGLANSDVIRQGMSIQIAVPESKLGEFNKEIMYDSDYSHYSKLENYIIANSFALENLESNDRNNYIIDTFRELTEQALQLKQAYDNPANAASKGYLLAQLITINEQRRALVEEATQVAYQAPIADISKTR